MGKYPLDLLDALQLDDQLVFYQQVAAIAAVQAYAFVLYLLRMVQLKPNSILRVLRALRGEFSFASVPCKLKLEGTTHSKRRRAEKKQ